MTTEIKSPTKYEKNYKNILKYYKKKYNDDTNDEFRKKEINRIYNYNKDKYKNDDEYKAKRVEYQRQYRLRTKVKQLKQEGYYEKIDAMIKKLPENSGDINIIKSVLV